MYSEAEGEEEVGGWVGRRWPNSSEKQAEVEAVGG